MTEKQADSMMRFVALGRKMPAKRKAGVRREDFREIYREYARGKLEAQSARCAQCGVPFCQIHCPLQNNIPDWLKLAAERRWQEAYEASQATNSFPELCGRICPQDRLCEGACVIEQSGHGSVTIGAIERDLADRAWDEGWVPPITPPDGNAPTVGIIGTGPAGLAAADQLLRHGVRPVLYERQDRAGGLLTYGIPGFKLEKTVVARRIAHITEGGARFVLNCEIGRDLPFADLRARHDAILIASGVYMPRPFSVPEAAGSPSVAALDYLIASNRKGFGDTVPAFESGALNGAGKRVLVIGGGDTAMDCVRTAVRQGAACVQCLYRRDRENMPGSAREVANAEEEGAAFLWMRAPKALLSKGGVRAVRMRLGPPGHDGRRQTKEIPGTEQTIEADLVIKALGFLPEPLAQAWQLPDLALQPWGAVKVRYPAMQTNLEGVFAAGDIVRGASLVVWAIREGREAAEGILAWLARTGSTKRRAA